MAINVKDRNTLLWIYTVMNKNVSGRISYAQLLQQNYRHVLDETYPGWSPGESFNKNSVLGILHAALVTEYYKAIEIMAAMLHSMHHPPADQASGIFGATGDDVDQFFSGVDENMPQTALRKFFPLPDMAEVPFVGATNDDQDAVDAVFEFMAMSLQDFLIMMKEDRQRMKPFRHRFSHTIGMVLGGSDRDNLPDDAHTVVPLLKSDAPTEEPQTTGFLVCGPRNNARLVNKLLTVLQLELDMLQLRYQWIVNEGIPTLPHILLGNPARPFPAELTARYQQALSKVAYPNTTARVVLEFTPGPKDMEYAMELYNDEIPVTGSA